MTYLLLDDIGRTLILSVCPILQATGQLGNMVRAKTLDCKDYNRIFLPLGNI